MNLFILSFGEDEILLLGWCVDNRDEHLSCFEWIGDIVCFRHWEIVLRVQVCGDRSLIDVISNTTTERETVGFDGDCFIGVCLEQPDVRNVVVCRDLKELQVAKLIVDVPSDFTLPFYVMPFGNPMS